MSEPHLDSELHAVRYKKYHLAGHTYHSKSCLMVKDLAIIRFGDVHAVAQQAYHSKSSLMVQLKDLAIMGSGDSGSLPNRSASLIA